MIGEPLLIRAKVEIFRQIKETARNPVVYDKIKNQPQDRSAVRVMSCPSTKPRHCLEFLLEDHCTV